ncbi:hypothetical protein E3T55_08405 [Cryobacterium frigoriphilum]|uniref:Lipopolysaccharide biosynthesis protein n=1 Tax=Cryobacterium frigoriphilum TaxID=1259150 RepID=A0A4R9A288_9MICO|nr:oligosaccharide flippase family protein [Cryobacterium frigoriphilum]TFD50809.1 hypothetical protein E3T55_08405 [Cryobacterium frigoriphilum]
MKQNAKTTSWAQMTTWLLSANILRNVGLIVVLVVLARLTSAETVGRYALALAITTPIFVLAQMGLKGVYLTMHHDYRFRSYALVQLVMVAAAVIVSVGVALVFNRDLIVTVTLVAVIKVADSLSEFFSAPLQKYDAARRIFWAYLTSAVLGSAVTGVALALTRDLDVALAGLAATSLFVAIFLMGFPARRLVRGREGDAHALLAPAQDRRRILRAGLPMGVAGAILALVSSMPQYFLARDHGEGVVGYFVVLLYVFAIVDIFSGTLTQAWIPKARLALENTDGDHFRFLRSTLVTTGWWSLVLMPLAIIGLVIVSLLLPIVFGPEYVLSFAVALPLFVGIVVLPSTHFGGTAVAVQNFYVHGITLSIGSALVSLIACSVLIPGFSAAGALWAISLAYAARGVFAFVILYLRARSLASAR